MLSYDRTTEIMSFTPKYLLEARSFMPGAAGEKAKRELASRAATKSIVKNAVVGGIVAGPAGAVVGGMVGKTKHDLKHK